MQNNLQINSLNITALINQDNLKEKFMAPFSAAGKINSLDLIMKIKESWDQLFTPDTKSFFITNCEASLKSDQTYFCFLIKKEEWF